MKNKITPWDILNYSLQNIFFKGIEVDIVGVQKSEETIANFQWFWRRPSPLNVFGRSDHCHQWFYDGFLMLLPSLSMVFDGSGPLVKRCDGFDGSLWSKQLWSSPLSSLFRPLLTTLKCTDFGLISKRCNSLKQFFLKLLRHLLLHLNMIAACYSFSRYVGNFLKMWAEELLMIEKMVTSFQNPSAHISGKLPTFLEKPLPIWRKLPFWRGNKVRNCPIFFVWPRHIYDRYIFKKNWPKSVSPTLSSAEKNLHPPMWGCHHQLDNQNKYPMVNTKII